MKLGVTGEGIKISRNGKTEDKVMYKLSNPDYFKNRKMLVVGGGNSAVEAAVDLVARRHGDQIKFRVAEEINEVTLVAPQILVLRPFTTRAAVMCPGASTN